MRWPRSRLASLGGSPFSIIGSPSKLSAASSTRRTRGDVLGAPGRPSSPRRHRQTPLQWAEVAPISTLPGTRSVSASPRLSASAPCLSASRIHVALTLDRLLAIGHEPIVGRWPSLLVFTSTASFRLDPAHTPQQRRGRRHLQSAVDEDRELAFRGSTPGEPSRRESDKPMNTRWSALENSVECRSRQASDRPVRTPSDAPKQTRSETRT